MTGIKFIPDEELSPKDVIFSMSSPQNWGAVSVDTEQAHNYSKGEGVIVAVLDTGSPEHNDLPNCLPAINCTPSVTPSDRQGHGTHVSGIIGANNAAGIVGIAPKCKILPVKVLGDDGMSDFETLALGINAAVEHGAHIINMSLGAPVQPPDILVDAVRNAYARGVIMIAAAGNDGKGVNYPAKLDEIIAVAAVDSNGNLWDKSSRGPEIDVQAGGVNIYSTYKNNSYALLSGTSQAAPIIAGICALLLSYAKANPEKLCIGYAQDMIHELDKMCDPQGRMIRRGDIGFGIPKFANYRWGDSF
jgi:subtilisin family serine protease